MLAVSWTLHLLSVSRRMCAPAPTVILTTRYRWLKTHLKRARTDTILPTPMITYHKQSVLFCFLNLTFLLLLFCFYPIFVGHDEKV